MRKQRDTETAATWGILNTRRKVAVITIAGVFLAGLIFFTAYCYHQHQQALILAEQQEQERLTAEQAEAERVAAEEQARLEQEAHAEAERLAAEAEAARLEAERIEQERIAAEEEQARLEAEAQAEAERIAAEEAAAAAQARQQAEVTEQQQPTANQASDSAPGNESSETQKQDKGEPTSGRAKEMADRMNAVWTPELDGWVYIDMLGNRTLIRRSGGSTILYD